MKKIFITGGSGFIGSHLVKYLVEQGYTVTNYGVKKPINIYGSYIEGNIMNYEHVKSSMKDHDAVCHLAAVVGVQRCFKNDSYVKKINYLGSMNVIKAAEENNIKNILFASSSEVYGQGSKNSLLTEETTTLPITIYGETKLMIEKELYKISQKTDMKISVVRYCNVYGKNQRDEFVIPIFIKNAINNTYLDIVGDGNQIRSFIHVDDAVEGTVRTLMNYKKKFDIYNISSQNPITINELADSIIKIVGSGMRRRVKCEELGRVPDKEIIYRIPSNEKAKQHLNFMPKKELLVGITEMLSQYK